MDAVLRMKGAMWLGLRDGQLTGARARLLLGIAAAALLVSGAYYVGARIGFVLKFPPVTPSVLWPPNAILTATLLLTPARRWWIYLLAAFPAHLLVQLQALWATPVVLLLFATNCSEALLAAACVRLFSDASTRFDTLRRVTVFIVGAGLVAPFVSSFADAAVVAGLREEPYWLVWRTRFFSNVLTELTLVPALVMAVSGGMSWIRTAPRSRHVEAALVIVGLLTVGLAALAAPMDGVGIVAGALSTPLVFMLPFLLWSAVRLGPGGISLSLLLTASLAIWAGTRGSVFPTLSPAEGVLALQVSLSVLGIPLMCLAAVMEERRRTNAALEDRLSFEKLLSDLSSTFVHLPGHEIDQVIQAWLRRLGQFLGLDRVTIRRFSGDGQALAMSHAWGAPNSGPVPPIIPSLDMPWAVSHLRGEQAVVFTRASDLPEASALDKEWFRRTGVRSGLMLPLVASGHVFGSLALFTITSERSWPEEVVQRLRLVAEVFANALSRKEGEDALRTSEAMKSGILASLSSQVALLDGDGRIIAVNESWTRFADQIGDRGEAGVGGSYLDVWRHALSGGAPHAGEAVAGITEVLDRSRPIFALDYACPTPAGERWFAMSVVPLSRPEGGAVVSHTDITERKRAEMEAQRSRQELAHFTRVSTMGELTASLAHELSQPLTAILTNAQAARRFLEATPADLGEVLSILADIIDDDKRASEVIQRLRDLLRKSEAEFHPLDLNVLIRDVAKLLSSDALIRNVTVTLDLDPKPVVVSGDRVQLQQVVLNLLLNAMDAMAECAGSKRTIVVRTAATDLDVVHVSVQDAGTGLRQGSHDLVFQPFYTTKPTGMGMGLAIARSILEAHDGVIWARDNPTGGATFHFALPIARAESA